MRTTVFSVQDAETAAQAVDQPPWRPLAEYTGEPLRGVRSCDVAQARHAEMQLYEIAAGGHFAMHSSPDVAFCQIVRGRGMLGLPGGREISYTGPELYVFQPDTLHDWHAIEEDTLLAVCVVAQRD
jgi:quercetin dioxygenase-like cupin family protein